MLDITSSILLMTALFNAGLMLFIIRGNWKSPTNILFGVFLLALSLWALSLIGYEKAGSYELAVFFGKGAYLMGMIIAMSLYLFSHAFPDSGGLSKRSVAVSALLTALFGVALYTPSYLIHQIIFINGQKDPTLGIFEYIVFVALFLFFYVGGTIRLWRKFLGASEREVRIKLLLIALVVTSTGLGGAYYNILLPSPLFGDFQYLWTGPIFTTPIAILITYAVFRFRLFNAKVIAVEFIIATLWIFTLLRTLLASDAREQLFNAALFFLVFALGILLIKSVRKEIDAREELEELTKKLEKANERLKELDRQKSEFLSIASHQLRSPLSSIMGYASMLAEGSFGKIPQGAQEALNRVVESTRLMSASVEDFLNVSRIEQGRMKYDFATFDLAELAETVKKEQEPIARERGVALALDIKERPAPVCADLGKIKQVIMNLVDNALKYTPKGSITISVSANAKTIQLRVSDTGVGIPPEELPKLFNKFVRSKNAHEVNVSGTGLGLYVAKEIVKSHQGRIWAESKGEGKGTTFVVELKRASSKHSG